MEWQRRRERGTGPRLAHERWRQLRAEDGLLGLDPTKDHGGSGDDPPFGNADAYTGGGHPNVFKRTAEALLERAKVRPALARARKVLGWPKRRKLAHAFLREYSYKRLKLAQHLGQLGVLLTCCAVALHG